MEILTHPKIKLRPIVKKFLSDTLTPVSLYLKLRDHFTYPVLLETNDFSSLEDCFSIIGLDAIGAFKVSNRTIQMEYPGGEKRSVPVTDMQSVPNAFQEYVASFELDYQGEKPWFNGLFGHTGFEGVQYFDSLEFDQDKKKIDIPEIRYTVYRYVLAINHFKDELMVIENLLPGQQSELKKLENLIHSQKVATHPFYKDGEETSNLTDEEYMDLVRIGKKHCQLGDVFQIVFSRQFAQRFRGDEFCVYRVLRSINPSPNLFYFDYGNYKIFGSSPESQMVIKNGVATVNPIAGTYRRSGELEEDARRAKALSEDPKENAEHIMLVDLARNDLGRHAKHIKVKNLKDIHFFSHVIHMVSKVEGELEDTTNPFQIFGDTFPAGTLSGAPKYKAMELINKYENQNRASYGGALGYIDFEGNMNQAIVIRSFLSKDNTLYYQAGGGIVVASEPEKELQEVNNKLGALTKALVDAEHIK